MKDLKDFYERFNIGRTQFARLVEVSKTALLHYEEAYEQSIDTFDHMQPKVVWKIERAIYLIEDRELVRPKPCSRIENQLFENQIKIILEKNGVLD